MALQNNQSMNLVLSTDAKPRLKWTPELHYRFVEAVSQLGGADKATPKSLMRVMGIPGLTLYHLKSHLQKYRLGKSQQSSDSCIENSNNTTDDRKQEEATEIQSREESFNRETVDRLTPPTQINQSLQIAQALQMQMEVQRKLHEQIEVQKHLQLRIEAQGKYLQSVLKKAQETLAGYCSSTVTIELAKAELSQLVSMVNSGCTSSSLSELTEFGGSELNESVKEKLQGVCSVESSLTSSESSGRNEEKQCENFANQKHSVEDGPCNSNLSPRATGKRRSSGASFNDNFIDRNSGSKMRKHELHLMIDLNRKYQNDNDSGPKQTDLNCHGTENPSGRF